MNTNHTVDSLSSQNQSTKKQTDYPPYAIPVHSYGTTENSGPTVSQDLQENSSQISRNEESQVTRITSPTTPLPLTLEAQGPQWSPKVPLSAAPLGKRPGRRPMAAVVLLASVIVLVVLLLPFLWVSPPSSTLTLAVPTVAPVGQVVFSSSGQLSPNSAQGINDNVTVTLHSLKNPAAGKALYAWLLPDQTNDEIKPILLGTLAPSHGAAQITYNDSNHTDLLTTYSAFRITEEGREATPYTPSLDQPLWRYSGHIPAAPTPEDENHYSLLSHLRHLLAEDPNLRALKLSGGLDIWLDRNSEKVLEYATAARDDWPNQGGSAALTHRQIVRILQYLDGVNYSWQDTPSGTRWLIDPQAGHIGLLDMTQSQEPPGYLSHVLLHLSGLINSPGATQGQKQLAKQINVDMQHIITLYKAMRDDARTLVKMSDEQLRQPNALALLDALASKANTAYAGQLDPMTGKTQIGINAIHGQLQTLGTFNVMPIY